MSTENVICYALQNATQFTRNPQKVDKKIDGCTFCNKIGSQTQTAYKGASCALFAYLHLGRIPSSAERSERLNNSAKGQKHKNRRLDSLQPPLLWYA